MHDEQGHPIKPPCKACLNKIKAVMNTHQNLEMVPGKINLDKGKTVRSRLKAGLASFGIVAGEFIQNKRRKILMSARHIDTTICKLGHCKIQMHETIEEQSHRIYNI